MFTTSTPSPVTQGMRGTGPRRLRESCEPCSAAKVRCSKGKPVCTRCTERDLPCVYFATRRSGRPPNKSTNSSKAASRSNSIVHIPAYEQATGPEVMPGQNCFPSFPALDPITILPEPLPIAHTSPGFETSSSSSLSLETHSEWSSRELDDFMSTLVPVAGLDSISLFPDGLLQTDDMSLAEVTSTSSDSSTHPSVGDCDCLTTALGLLSKFDGLAGDGSGQPVSPTESLIEKNEGVAVAVENILQCRYAQSSQVLIILALVVSKVLDQYLRASRVAPLSQPQQGPDSTRAFTMAHFHGEDGVRTAGKLVLGELHRALKLVNGLAARLNERGNCHSPSDWLSGSHSPGSSREGFGEPSVGSFSSTMLNQLATDLRAQLKSVVAKITGMLQGAA